MDLTLYQSVIKHQSVSEAFVNDTKSNINNIFLNSPLVKQCKIDGIDSESIISQAKDGKFKMLFRPDTIVDKGSYVEVGTDTFIIIDFNMNEIYPKGKSILCNSSLKWKDELGVVHDIKCNIKGDNISVEEDKLVVISDSKLVVTVQYNDNTKSIKPQQRFIIDGNAYEVDVIDRLSNVYNSKGYIQFDFKSSSLSKDDNQVDNIANDTKDSSWGSW